MTGILDIFIEKDGVASMGETTEDISIPSGEEWEITCFGGGASAGQCEVQLKYSEDDGSTWTNPFSSTDERIRAIHLVDGSSDSVNFPTALPFCGGSGRILRVIFKNYGLTTAEIAAWFNGRRNVL